MWLLGRIGHSVGSWLRKAEPGQDVAVQRDAWVWCLLLGSDFGVNVSKSSDPWVLEALGNRWDTGRFCVWPGSSWWSACWHVFPWTTVWVCLLTSVPVSCPLVALLLWAQYQFWALGTTILWGLSGNSLSLRGQNLPSLQRAGQGPQRWWKWRLWWRKLYFPNI